MFGRKQIAMIMAEFLGTGILTLVVLGVSKSTICIPYFVSIAAGVVLVAMTLALGAISGAQFNPAITIGLWTVRKIKSLPAIVYVAAQLLGGGAAYLLFRYFIGQSWQNTGHFDAKVLVGEAVGAFIFSLAWAAAVYQRLETGKAATVVGLGLMLGIIVASSASGGLLNPAVALGVRSWVWGSYVLGPVLGAIIGFNLYGFLFAPYSGVVEATVPAKKKK
jgi:glycerol uptake facilitator-like aquaporin